MSGAVAVAEQQAQTVRFLRSIGVQPLVDLETGELVVDVAAMAAAMGVSSQEVRQSLAAAGLETLAPPPRLGRL